MSLQREGSGRIQAEETPGSCRNLFHPNSVCFALNQHPESGCAVVVSRARATLEVMFYELPSSRKSQ